MLGSAFSMQDSRVRLLFASSVQPVGRWRGLLALTGCLVDQRQRWRNPTKRGCAFSPNSRILMSMRFFGGPSFHRQDGKVDCHL